jgi:hypothetical protein
MMRKRCQPTRGEWARLTSKRPVARHIPPPGGRRLVRIGNERKEEGASYE